MRIVFGDTFDGFLESSPSIRTIMEEYIRIFSAGAATSRPSWLRAVCRTLIGDIQAFMALVNADFQYLLIRYFCLDAYKSPCMSCSSYWRGNPYWRLDELTKPICFVINCTRRRSIRYSLLSTPLVPALFQGSKSLR